MEQGTNGVGKASLSKSALLSFRQLPLRMVLIIPFVLQTLGLASVVGYLSYLNGQKAVDALVQDLQSEVQSRIRDRLNSYMAMPKRVVQANWDNINLDLLDIEDTEKLGYYFWHQRKVFEVPYILYGYDSGKYAAVGYNDSEGKTITIDEVNPARNGNAHLYNWGADARGNRTKVLAQWEVFPMKKEGWYAQAVKHGKPVWSDVYNWEIPPYPLSIATSRPVYKNNKFHGVIAVEQRLSQISDFLRQLKISQSGKAFIIERNGLLIASSEQQQPFVIKDGKPIRIGATDAVMLPLIQATARSLQSRFGNLNKIQESQQLNFDFKNQRQLVQIVPWRDPLELDWLVVVVVPEADFTAQIQANTQRTALLSLAAIAIATGLGVLMARWISYPVLQLSRASKAFAQAAQQHFKEAYPQQPMVKSGIQELATLSQAFHQMGTQLQQSFAELETANQELEQRVAERTQDLQQANLKITQLNQQLQTDNLRMSAELDVSRRLQEIMLPKTAELTHLQDLDIACFMEAAQEVGGDYYDVILDRQHVAIGIGDVTGHGLESGVLMIMAQTAVRTLLAANEQDSTKFLTALNQVLYDNAQRLSPGKNMTFALLQYQNQHLKITGQHEDILVFRTDGTVEQVETVELGMPLGLIQDIQNFIGQTQIQLAPGDGVALYTDGISEAEGAERSLYGLDRLKKVIQQHWALSAQEIQERVIADLRSHIGETPVYDDMTLVILKRTYERT
jgi:phosphoserine phosphatase RsbU/P